ncbi:hypothetical protein D3C83_143210 [compost metagenome]
MLRHAQAREFWDTQVQQLSRYAGQPAWLQFGKPEFRLLRCHAEPGASAAQCARALRAFDEE